VNKTQWYFNWGGKWYSCDRAEARWMARDGYKVGCEINGAFKMLHNRGGAKRAA
jgi:hypothetical protein